MARGDEGCLLALGYSTQRGYGRNHPFAGEIHQVEVAAEVYWPRCAADARMESLKETPR